MGRGSGGFNGGGEIATYCINYLLQCGQCGREQVELSHRPSHILSFEHSADFVQVRRQRLFWEYGEHLQPLQHPLPGPLQMLTQVQRRSIKRTMQQQLQNQPMFGKHGGIGADPQQAVKNPADDHRAA